MNLCEIPWSLYDFSDKTKAIFIKVYLEKDVVHSSSERIKRLQRDLIVSDHLGWVLIHRQLTLTAGVNQA